MFLADHAPSQITPGPSHARQTIDKGCGLPTQARRLPGQGPKAVQLIDIPGKFVGHAKAACNPWIGAVSLAKLKGDGATSLVPPPLSRPRARTKLSKTERLKSNRFAAGSNFFSGHRRPLAGSAGARSHRRQAAGYYRLGRPARGSFRSSRSSCWPTPEGLSIAWTKDARDPGLCVIVWLTKLSSTLSRQLSSPR